jgi:hypothetical protein
LITNIAEPRLGLSPDDKEKALKPAWFKAFLAEEEGFEPSEPCGSPDFESGPL